jgi:hypothetical protein
MTRLSYETRDEARTLADGISDTSLVVMTTFHGVSDDLRPISVQVLPEQNRSPKTPKIPKIGEFSKPRILFCADLPGQTGPNSSWLLEPCEVSYSSG